jgi:hypothetical protein
MNERLQSQELYDVRISRQIFFYKFSLHLNDLDTTLERFVKQVMLCLVTQIFEIKLKTLNLTRTIARFNISETKEKHN